MGVTVLGIQHRVSLSARRAWIEICYLDNIEITEAVALRKESVDRNFDTVQIVVVIMQSLSARRAWIEISMWCSAGKLLAVALRKESVDRNLYLFSFALALVCRSPQGERG